MDKILVIDPGKGWGHFVSKMYCYEELSKQLNSKIVFLTKKSTQAEHYLKHSSFCDEVLYLEESKKGFKNLFYNFSSFFKNIKKINKYNFKSCFIFHPSLRYLFIAKLSNIKDIWGLGLKAQNFFLKKNKKLYSSYNSKTVPNDNEALEFVKKITGIESIKYKPFYSYDRNKRDTVGIIIAASGYEKRWSIEHYIEVVDFLKTRGFKKFLIISGLDQKKDEDKIKDRLTHDTDITFSANKKIQEVLPYLEKCIFCIGNDTGFAHLSVNIDVETIIIHGDCEPQYYSNLIHHIDIDNKTERSKDSIHTIQPQKVINKLSNFLNGRDGRVV